MFYAYIVKYAANKQAKKWIFEVQFTKNIISFSLERMNEINIYCHSDNPVDHGFKILFQPPVTANNAVVFLDAIHYHVGSERRVVKKAVHIAIGIDLDGHKDVFSDMCFVYTHISNARFAPGVNKSTNRHWLMLLFGQLYGNKCAVEHRRHRLRYVVD